MKASLYAAVYGAMWSVSSRHRLKRSSDVVGSLRRLGVEICVSHVQVQVGRKRWVFIGIVRSAE